jgi:Ca-activated chloride channel homolog
MRFAHPAFLILLAALAWLLWLRWPGRRRRPDTYVGLPSTFLVQGLPRGLRTAVVHLPFAARVAGLLLAVVAMARPQLLREDVERPDRGRNIVMALDVSSSMRTEDLGSGTRLQAAKGVLQDFVRGREHDLMGLVVFAGKPFTQVPLTTDPEVLSRMIDEAEVGMLPDGTGIGTALATSLSHLSGLAPTASAVVLITDGMNNTGRVPPLRAAEAARTLGIRVYTIGVSAPRDEFIEAWRPARLRDRQSIGGLDEEVLRRIAQRTGGRYFRAMDADALARIMRELDRLETIELRRQRKPTYEELFPFFLLPALSCFVLAQALRATWLRTVP